MTEARPSAEVLATSCRRDLDLVLRMPYDAEYVTPQEILRIVLLCRVYDVDWTLGLEPRGEDGELVRRVPVWVGRGAQRRVVARVVRVKRHVLLEDFQGTEVPDGDLLWAMEILGQLRAAMAQVVRRDVGVA